MDHLRLIVGIAARFLMPGRDPAGFVVTTVMGIVGALLGGFLGRAAGWYAQGEPAAFPMAMLGAIVLLAYLSGDQSFTPSRSS